MSEIQENPPGIDDATMAAWRAEAKANPPNLDDWAHMVAMLRLSAHLDRHAAQNPELPGSAVVASECATRAVVTFLQRQPYLDRHGEAVAPLVRLHLALWDVTEGRAPAMFKPVPKAAAGGRGNPGRGGAVAMIQGIAARTLCEFIAAGVKEEVAARRIADALRLASRRGLGPVKDSTIKNWRDRFLLGRGPGAPEMAIQQFRERIPDSFGVTALARAENLLRFLRERSAALV